MSLLRAVAFGDIVSTEGDCEAGRLAVRTMRAAFDRVGKPARFKVAVETLEAQLAEQEDRWFYKNIPFSPVCGVIKGIGQQAEAVTRQILESTGNAPLAPSSGLKDPTDTAITIAAIGAAATIAAVVVPAIFERRRRR